MNIDKYRTVKCSLVSILKNKNNASILFDATNRTNQIIIYTYQFLRLWILYNYKNNSNIPIITEDTIKMVFKTLTIKSSGPKLKGSNLEIFNNFNIFYEDNYKKNNNIKKINGKNLSQILNYTATDILTNIENNIKLHFMKYIRRFVNSSFKKVNNDLIDTAEKGKKTILRKQLKEDLFMIKEDLFNNTLNSNKIYHDWIIKHKNNILPTSYKNSYEFDIQNNPQKYFKYMIYMCLEIEKIGSKSFQFFPLRNNLIPKYIPIDTKTIIELLVNENKNDFLIDIENQKDSLWSGYFNLNNKIFKQTNYVFDYRISTDCFGISIQLIHKSYLEKEQNKKNNMKQAKKRIKTECENMTNTEKELYRINIKLEKKQKLEENKILNKQLKDKQKEEFKKLPKEKKEEVKLKIVKNKYIEYPYLEQLNDNQLKNLEKSNWLVVDPGKKNLLYMKNLNGKKLRYTNKKHLKITKRLKYQKLLQNYKNKNNIFTLENILTGYNSKTCNYDEFKKFIRIKNHINDILLVEYQKDIFRKYKWFTYINKQKAESKLINEIKTTYGNDINMIYGDYSSYNMKHLISTPNKGLKRILSQCIPIYSIDEFRTSKLNYLTEKITDNLFLPDKKGKIREIHSILTFQMENLRTGCINRDENAVNNMLKLVKYYFQFKDR
jgi:hypothetical protein